MMLMHVLLKFISLASLASAFCPSPRSTSSSSFGYIVNSLVLEAVSYDDISDIGFDVSVAKPLGVVFGENLDPYNGLVVDDIELGKNAGIAGLRVGDQLVSINEQVVVGKSFETVMTMLKEGPPVLDLQMYRGGVRSLYVILQNRAGDMTSDDEDDEGEEAVIMDENYVSPVVIDVSQYDDSPLSVGDFVNAFKNLSKKLTASDEDAPPAPTKQQGETKKSGGIFGMFQQETIQLDGDDATGIGMSGKRK